MSCICGEERTLLYSHRRRRLGDDARQNKKSGGKPNSSYSFPISAKYFTSCVTVQILPIMCDKKKYRLKLILQTAARSRRG
jgi:hypothetical protein